MAFSGIAHTFPRIREGRALLEIQNDVGQPITVKTILAGFVGNVAKATLLKSPIMIQDGESHVVDVSEGLKTLFGVGTSEPQTAALTVELSYEPRPKQAAPPTYRVKFNRGLFVEFE